MSVDGDTARFSISMNKTPEISASRIQPEIRVVIEKYHLWILALIAISLLLGAVLAFLPKMFQFALLGAIPAAFVCILILRNPYTGVFLILLYNFLRPYDFIPALIPLRLSMILEIITLLSLVIHMTQTKKKPLWGFFSSLYLGYLGVILVGVFIAANNFYAYQVFEAMLVIFIIYFLGINLIDSQKRLYQITWMLLLVHLYFAIKGTLTFISGSYLDTVGRATSGQVGSGFIGDENDFALIMIVFMPFAYYGVLFFKNKLKLFFAFMLFWFLLAIVSSFSRGGLVGLGCLIIYNILTSRKKARALGISLALAGAMIAFAPADYWQEALSIGQVQEGTAASRIRYWKAGLGMFMDHPLFGVGAENGGVYMPQYVSGVENPNVHWGRAFHGTIPQILAETGFLGFGLFAAMMITALWLLLREKKRPFSEGGNYFSHYMAESLMASIIGYITTSTFVSTVYYPYIWTIYILVVALVFIQRNKRQAELVEIDSDRGEGRVVSSR